jgi:hypothetical protein
MLLALPGRSLAQPPAPAGEEDPRAIEARKACASGEVERGIKLLADYLTTTNDATAIYNMGRCYQQNGMPDKAVPQFREYLRKAPDLTAQDRADVERTIAELESQRSKAPALRGPTLIEPAPQPGVGSTAADVEGRPALRTTGLALGAVGVVAVGASVVFGLNVRSANSDLHDPAKVPDWSAYHKRQDEGRRAETLQWVMLGVGGAALVAGAVCYVLALPRPQETALAPWLVPGGGGLALARKY